MIHRSSETNLQACASRLVIVCYHLPVRVFKDASGKWAASWGESLIARSSAGSYADENLTLWIGCIHGGLNRRKLTAEDERSIRAVLKPMSCIPIFSTHSKDAYLNYCKRVLWPSFHNVTVLDQSCACWNEGEDPALTWDQECIGAGSWGAYEALNVHFKDELLSILEEGDTIWVRPQGRRRG